MNNKEYIVTRLEIFYNVLSVCFLGSFTFRKTAADRVERDIESQIDVYEAYGYEFSDKEKIQIREDYRLVASDDYPVRATEWVITESIPDANKDVFENVFEIGI